MTHVDTTLGSDGVRSGREKLGNTSSLESTLSCGKENVNRYYQHDVTIIVELKCEWLTKTESGSETGSSSSNDDGVEPD